MNLFSWKKNKTIDMFASELANEFFSLVPPDIIHAYFKSKQQDRKNRQNKSKNKKENRSVESNLMSLVKQMQQFKILHSLGTYGKARLQLKFNERLEELGYDKETVSQLSDFVLLHNP